MTPDATFRELQQRMLGGRVTSTRVFLFTLQIYIASDLGDVPDLEIWCEQSWHVRTASGLVSGSGAIQGPDTFDDDAEIERASATITRVGDAARQVLVGESLTGLVVDPTTHALTASFSSGVVVATFSDDPDQETLWVLRDRASDTAVRGTNHGMAAGSRAVKRA